MIQVRVQSLGLDQSSQTPVVILEELEGSRVLPIWIGPGEASAIAMELAGIKFSRPLTHDLAVTLIRGLGGVLRRVVISRVEANTYYAEMVIQRGSEVFTVDARPSDSVAIALRMKADLFTTEDLLTSGPLVVPEQQAEDAGDSVDEPLGGSGAEGAKGMSPEALQEYLRKLNPEDFGRFQP